MQATREEYSLSKLLQALIAQPEGERLERTAQFDFDGIQSQLGRTLCAFANDLSDVQTPGYFLIGVKDDKAGGGLSGYPYRDKDEQKIINWLSDGLIRPEVAVNFERFQSEVGDVLVVRIDTSSSAPHRFDKKIWVRVGNTTREATPEQETRIHEARRHRAGLSFDCMPCPRTSIDDLDKEAFYSYRALTVSSETIEANQRDLPLQLAALNLLDLRSNAPTYAGLVCFGKTTSAGYKKGMAAGAGLVQFDQYDGHTLADEVVQSLEINTNLYATREKIDALLDAHIKQRSFQMGTEERVQHSYPKKALRELIHNAIAHRDYALGGTLQIRWLHDRVEIQSPGALYPPANVENFQEGVASRRNPAILDVMREMNMIERRGSGIGRVQFWLKQNGNPPAKFEFLGGTVLRVTVRSAV
ncbi:MAG: ATP-binding protein [Gammaproteobacteria bacterium]|nr:ATP-binding protein [Gammaproteobacteria bacterium]